MRLMAAVSAALVLFTTGLSDAQEKQAARSRSAATFDFNVFYYKSSGPARLDSHVQRFRAELRDALAAQIEWDSHANHLRGAQRQKLELAGRGDIKYLFDWIDAQRDDFEGMDPTKPEGRSFLLGVCKEKASRKDVLFGKGSLYEKVLFTIQDSEGVGR